MEALITLLSPNTMSPSKTSPSKCCPLDVQLPEAHQTPSKNLTAGCLSQPISHSPKNSQLFKLPSCQENLRQLKQHPRPSDKSKVSQACRETPPPACAQARQPQRPLQGSQMAVKRLSCMAGTSWHQPTKPSPVRGARAPLT